MAGKVNKNSSRGSGPVGSGKGLQIGGEIAIIKPLNNGKHAYVLNAVTGKTFHGKTDSAEFADVLAVNCEAGYETRLRTELAGLAATYPADGWDAVLARFDKATTVEETVEAETVSA